MLPRPPPVGAHARHGKPNPVAWLIAIGALVTTLVWIIALNVHRSIPAPSPGSPQSEPAVQSAIPPPLLNQREATAPAKPVLPKWEMGAWRFQRGEYVGQIIGEVTYNGEETLSYASINFDLFDSFGRRVGSAIDNINNLHPGDVWRFKAIVFEDSATRAQLSGISAF